MKIITRYLIELVPVLFSTSTPSVNIFLHNFKYSLSNLDITYPPKKIIQKKRNKCYIKALTLHNIYSSLPNLFLTYSINKTITPPTIKAIILNVPKDKGALGSLKLVGPIKIAYIEPIIRPIIVYIV